MEDLQGGPSIQRIVDYEPEDGVYALDSAGKVCNVPFAFKVDDGRWIEFADDVLPAVLSLLGASDLADCVGKFIQLSSAPVSGAVGLQPGVYLVGVANT